MKKIYLILAALAAVCLLSACADRESVSTPETTAAETSSEETTTAIETATAAASDYTYNFAERSGDTSEEQDRLYEFLSDNWYDTGFYKEADDFRAQMTEYTEYVMPEDYTIYADEYFADFDGDGNGELYVYRYTDLDQMNQWTTYRELWYTDGESCTMIYSGMGRGVFGGISEPQDGVPLMYIVPEISMGAFFQYADVYFIKDGKPTLYELPEGESFIYEVDIFIAPAGSEYNELRDALYEAKDDPESFQTIGWVNGELKIVSGYGKNGAEDT